MKSLFFGALLCCLAVGQYGYSDNYNYSAPVAAAQDCAADQPTGEQYCLYVKYEPCYSKTQRCVETQVACEKTCTRQVPKYYEVQRCKMVPQYYTETKCKYETECYKVPDTKCCKEYVTDTHVKYVPKYYWKHANACNQVAAPEGYTVPGACAPAAPAYSAPVSNGCASGSCGARY